MAKANSHTMPSDIKLHRKSAVLELCYAGSGDYSLSAEFLRVHSPSAEVRGHGKGQEVLQIGKRQVGILKVSPVGNYAIKLSFDDGHDSGIYSWGYLEELCQQHDTLWQAYLEKMTLVGASRDILPVGTQVINIQPLS
ncbi:MAG: 1-(5-phosphoribosyl)-5-((5-phosphoribosylamino)methylideneamino)imidazole-4-carboxamide isomerase [SAR86 cluster bacterium]|uniref:1-(5-phosphoribosyl)-5-((5-phosphoribosylamino)methylideneamino)imidazole-4-carboxamide isomerase n=1 Tax=SAR86 cluster bacterium TaxID=2030880 RepID=A0A2A4MGS6_9GAMM|nr:MAG: 1-(5-phosphoribosyl)-5-((5-phosphoribosylamino)methylideneamino)imidazole-4-carboxamide isomerase [SAR86 cluster bacterium]